MCDTCGCKGAETFEAKGYKGISASKIQVLEKYIENGGKALDYHELPYHIQRQLEMGKVHELLYQDVNRWLQDNAPNPHHAMPSWLSAEGEDIFSDKDEAMERAKELGTTEIHSHKINGDTIYMPFKTHEEYKKMMKSKGHMSFGSETFEAIERFDRDTDEFIGEKSWEGFSPYALQDASRELYDFIHDYLNDDLKMAMLAIINQGRDNLGKMYDDSMKGFEAETFEASVRENKDGTIVLSDAEFRRCKYLHNGNYLWYDEELKFIKHLVNSVKLEKVRRYNDVEMPLVRKYEKALKDQEYKMRMRFREQLYDYGIRRGRNRVNDKTVYYRSEGFEAETFEAKGYRNPYAFRKPKLVDTDKYKGHSEGHKNGTWDLYEMYGSNDKLQLEIRPLHDKWGITIPITSVGVKDAKLIADAPMLLEEVKDGNRIKEYIYQFAQYPSIKKIHLDDLIAFIEEDDERFGAEDEDDEGYYLLEIKDENGEWIGIDNDYEDSDEVMHYFNEYHNDGEVVRLITIMKDGTEKITEIEDFMAETFEASGIDTFSEPFTEMKTGSILKKAILLGSLGVGAFVGNKLRK